MRNIAGRQQQHFESPDRARHEDECQCRPPTPSAAKEKIKFTSAATDEPIRTHPAILANIQLESEGQAGTPFGREPIAVHNDQYDRLIQAPAWAGVQAASLSEQEATHAELEVEVGAEVEVENHEKLNEEFERFVDANLTHQLDKLNLAFYLNEYETRACDLGELLAGLLRHLFAGERLANNPALKYRLLRYIKRLYISPRAATQLAAGEPNKGPAHPNAANNKFALDLRLINAMLRHYRLTASQVSQLDGSNHELLLLAGSSADDEDALRNRGTLPPPHVEICEAGDLILSPHWIGARVAQSQESPPPPPLPVEQFESPNMMNSWQCFGDAPTRTTSCGYEEEEEEERVCDIMRTTASATSLERMRQLQIGQPTSASPLFVREESPHPEMPTGRFAFPIEQPEQPDGAKFCACAHCAHLRDQQPEVDYIWRPSAQLSTRCHSSLSISQKESAATVPKVWPNQWLASEPAGDYFHDNRSAFYDPPQASPPPSQQHQQHQQQAPLCWPATTTWSLPASPLVKQQFEAPNNSNRRHQTDWAHIQPIEANQQRPALRARRRHRHEQQQQQQHQSVGAHDQAQDCGNFTSLTRQAAAYVQDEDKLSPLNEALALVPIQAKGRLPLAVAEQMSQQASKFVQHHNSSWSHLVQAGATGSQSTGGGGGGGALKSSATGLQVRRTLRVKIRKSKPILGIAIEGGFNVSGQLLPRIVCVHEEGAAYQCGKLRASDLILEVNGFRTANMTHDEIAETIANAYYQDERPYIEFLIGESVPV